jgi:translation elongation factor EF-1beta
MTVMKVFPAEEQDPAALAERVRAVKGCVKAEVIDYVFGAKVIQASFVCDDQEGVDYEEVVRRVDGVSEVQVEEVGLIS